MRNKLVLLCFLFSLAACAHTKDTLKSAQAFYFIRTPGIIAVDREGKPLTGPQLICVVYLEGKDSLENAIVQINGKAFQPNISLITAFPSEAGMSKADRKAIRLQPLPGNKLWKLSVVVRPQTNPSDELLLPDEIIVSGTVNKKSYKKTVQNITELESPMYQ